MIVIRYLAAVLVLSAGATAWVSHSCPIAFFNSGGGVSQIVRYCQ